MMTKQMYCAHAEQIDQLLNEMIMEGYSLPEALEQMRRDMDEAAESYKTRHEKEE